MTYFWHITLGLLSSFKDHKSSVMMIESDNTYAAAYINGMGGVNKQI